MLVNAREQIRLRNLAANLTMLPDCGKTIQTANFSFAITRLSSDTIYLVRKRRHHDLPTYKTYNMETLCTTNI